MKNIIKDLKEKYASHYLKYIPKDLEKEIIQNTNFLPKDISLKIRIFYIMNDLTANPKCKTCGKEFILTNELREFCSSKCSNSNPDKKLKCIDTNIKKYGVENANQFSKTKENDTNTTPDKIQELISLTEDILPFSVYGKILRQRQYHIDNNLTSLPKCEICGKEVTKFGSYTKGYYKTCSPECRKILADKTILDKYGVKNSFQSNEIKEKIKETNLKKYGVEYPSQSKELLNKRKESYRQKTGFDFPTQNPEVMEKSRETYNSRKDIIVEGNKSKFISKYGVDNPFKLPEIQEKIKQTNLEKYGVDNPFKSDEIKEKIKETNLEKYGVEFPIQNDEIKEKIKQTSLEKYGTEYPIQNEEISSKMKNTVRKKYFEILLDKTKDYFEPLFSLVEYIGLKDELKWKCKECGNEFVDIHFNSYQSLPRCPICNPYSHSKFETEIVDYIKSLGIENIITNDREVIKPLELDIYLPDFNIAFECNGVYWHQEDIKGKDYHQNKTDLCKNKGIQLIHIWEDWWYNKQDIVKSIINNKLGLNTTKIYGRDTEIKEIDFKESKIFIEENHIQGFINSSVNIGLYYNNELVSLMTFGKSRYDKGYDWELLRFCNKKYTNVIGGASKLFNYFSNNYLNNQNIISYALMDISNGKMYENLGFSLKGITKPNYFYIKGMKRESRQTYQKYKLKDLLKVFDENLSEKENMFINGYSRVYDSGSLIFSKGV